MASILLRGHSDAAPSNTCTRVFASSCTHQCTHRRCIRTRSAFQSEWSHTDHRFLVMGGHLRLALMASTEDSPTCLESESGPGTSLLLQLALVHEDQFPAPCTSGRLFVTAASILSNSLLSPARSSRPRVHLLSLLVVPAMERTCDLSGLPTWPAKVCLIDCKTLLCAVPC